MRATATCCFCSASCESLFSRLGSMCKCYSETVLAAICCPRAQWYLLYRQHLSPPAAMAAAWAITAVAAASAAAATASCFCRCCCLRRTEAMAAAGASMHVGAPRSPTLTQYRLRHSRGGGKDVMFPR